jgi:hypothetical protein
MAPCIIVHYDAATACYRPPFSESNGGRAPPSGPRAGEPPRLASAPFISLMRSSPPAQELCSGTRQSSADGLRNSDEFPVCSSRSSSRGSANGSRRCVSSIYRAHDFGGRRRRRRVGTRRPAAQASAAPHGRGAPHFVRAANHPARPAVRIGGCSMRTGADGDHMQDASTARDRAGQSETSWTAWS